MFTSKTATQIMYLDFSFDCSIYGATRKSDKNMKTKHEKKIAYIVYSPSRTQNKWFDLDPKPLFLISKSCKPYFRVTRTEQKRKNTLSLSHGLFIKQAQN